MGIRDLINRVTGVSRNRGMARSFSNRIRSQMQRRLSATAR